MSKDFQKRIGHFHSQYLKEIVPLLMGPKIVTEIFAGVLTETMRDSFHLSPVAVGSKVIFAAS